MANSPFRLGLANQAVRWLFAPSMLLALALPESAWARKIGKEFFCSGLFQRVGKSFNSELSDVVERSGFKVGVGSRLKIYTAHSNSIEGIFLGRYVSLQRETVGYLFYQEADDLVYVIPADKLKLHLNGRPVDDKHLKPVVAPVEQSGETCMAFALEYFVHQLDLNGLEGTSAVDKFLSTEAGRKKLYADLDYEYYQNARRRSNALNILNGELELIYKKYRDRLNLKCRSLDHKNYKTAGSFLEAMATALDKGSPILAEFYIGSDMTNSATRTIVAGHHRTEDPRLWLPRAKGEKNSGGHAIAVSDYFITSEGKMKFVIGDPDWGNVRVWDAEEIGERYKRSQMIAHICSRK